MTIDTPDLVISLNEFPHGEAMEKCLEVWANRRKKYGDSWKDNKEYQMMALIKEKVGRLEFNFESGSTDYESKEDTLIDLINWSLFYLQNLEDKKYENRNN